MPASGSVPSAPFGTRASAVVGLMPALTASFVQSRRGMSSATVVSTPAARSARPTRSARAERDLADPGAVDVARFDEARAVGAGAREDAVESGGEAFLVAEAVLERTDGIEVAVGERTHNTGRIERLDGHQREIGRVEGVGACGRMDGEIERAADVEARRPDRRDVGVAPDECHAVLVGAQSADEAAEAAGTEDDDLHSVRSIPGPAVAVLLRRVAVRAGVGDVVEFAHLAAVAAPPHEVGLAGCVARALVFDRKRLDPLAGRDEGAVRVERPDGAEFRPGGDGRPDGDFGWVLAHDVGSRPVNMNFGARSRWRRCQRYWTVAGRFQRLDECSEARAKGWVDWSGADHQANPLSGARRSQFGSTLLSVPGFRVSVFYDVVLLGDPLRTAGLRSNEDGVSVVSVVFRLSAGRNTQRYLVGHY